MENWRMQCSNNKTETNTFRLLQDPISRSDKGKIRSLALGFVLKPEVSSGGFNWTSVQDVSKQDLQLEACKSLAW